MNPLNSNNHHLHNIMTLTGQGYVSAVPDMAIIRLGVQSIGANLTEIQSENARISQELLEALRQMDILDIKTSVYSIEKNYEYENGTRIDRGYFVRNIFEIKMSNMEQVGMVIDTAVSIGANVVEYITFDLSNPEEYYEQALNLAVMNAIQKAISISNQLGLSLDPIPIRIVENSTMPIPFTQVSSFRERDFITPIEPGQKRIDAFVNVEFMY